MSTHAQFLPGVIINGVAKDDIPKAIERMVDSEGFERPVVKALTIPDPYPDIDAFPDLTGGVMGNIGPGGSATGVSIGEGRGLTDGVPNFIDMNNAIRNTGTAPRAWCQLAQEGEDNRFLGVVNPDTRPYTNMDLDTGYPKSNLRLYNYDVRANELIGVIRGAIFPVLCQDDVRQQDFLALGSDGKFKKQATPDINTAVGVAYQTASDNDIFEAFLFHRR